MRIDYGEINAADALELLRMAVGAVLDCPSRVCDPTEDCKTTAADALVVLRRAVGAVAQISCRETCE